MKFTIMRLPPLSPCFVHVTSTYSILLNNLFLNTLLLSEMLLGYNAISAGMYFEGIKCLHFQVQAVQEDFSWNS